MIAIRNEHPLDHPARDHLLDRCFGPERYLKTCEHLRRGRLPADGLARTVESDGRLVATVRMWNVQAGSAGSALLLGPIAVDPSLQGLRIGARLMRETLARAAGLGHRAVLLVGDEPYYRRFGFGRAAVAGLRLPGPCELDRFLGLDLVPGALAGARGVVAASGRRDGFRSVWAAANHEEQALSSLAA